MTPDSDPARSGPTRREFAKWLGAGAAVAGLGGCVREPSETILPYVHSPRAPVTGSNVHYATSMVLDGAATGLLVTSRDGRPIKIEGNPRHPASLGGTGAMHQASLLQLYDPDRAKRCQRGNRATTWGALAALCNPAALRARGGARGAGISLLLQPTSSPVELTLLDRLRDEFPDARIGVFAPLGWHGAIDASIALFGTPLIPQHDFASADAIISLDADFLGIDPFALRHAHDWASRRRGRRDSLLFVAETVPSSTGVVATDRIPATPDDLAMAATGLLAAVAGAIAPDWVGTHSPAVPARVGAWVTAAANALLANRGRSIALAGPRQPVPVHVVVAAINELLGNVGTTVWYTPPPFRVDPSIAQGDDALQRFVDASIDTAVITAINPCYSAPPAQRLTERLHAIRNTVYLGDYRDETAAAVAWHAPAAHYLESWGDARAWDGTISTVQPLIAPMYDGRTTAEFLAMLVGETATGRALVGRYDPDAVGDDALRSGYVTDSGFARQHGSVARDVVASMAATLVPLPARTDAVVVITPSAKTHDGRFAGNAWLQELPGPATRLTWDNAALMSPATADRFQVASGDVIALQNGTGTVDAPVLVTPGHADGAISLELGYGRTGAGLVRQQIGCDATALRTSSASFIEPVTVRRTGQRHDLATTQDHWSIEGRREEILGTPATVPPARPALPLYQPGETDPHGLARDQWAMTIDLDLCTGCSACVVACQSENNVPIVGRSGVLRHREMHWIRIDRYLDGPLDNPAVTVQPMLCQQCEAAPCEYVCPVTATTHSDDGINEMVYNRCVGTRFCSNNCPYKVRRFNWLAYNDPADELAALRENPDVSIRARGVMEKCTFCVQRVRHAQQDAEQRGDSRTGTVVTACQQACPVGAIVFGSLTDPASPVTALFDDSRARSSLDELGTRPRVHYLARDQRGSGRS
ncbi:MAG TPA: 4Fe-4S dicluster domain-containing protein [Gemmatimonadales bacterium]